MSCPAVHTLQGPTAVNPNSRTGDYSNSDSDVILFPRDILSIVLFECESFSFVQYPVQGFNKFYGTGFTLLIWTVTRQSTFSSETELLRFLSTILAVLLFVQSSRYSALLENLRVQTVGLY